MKESEGWDRTEGRLPCSAKRTYCHEFSHQNKTMILIYSSAIFKGKNIDPNANVSIVYKGRNSLLSTFWLVGLILSILDALSLNPCKNLSVLVSQCCVTKYLKTQGLQNTLAHSFVAQQRGGCIGCKLFHKPLLFSSSRSMDFPLVSLNQYCMLSTDTPLAVQVTWPSIAPNCGEVRGAQHVQSSSVQSLSRVRLFATP